MINLASNIIRIVLLLLQSGVLFENFRTVQVRTVEQAEGREFFALDFIGIIEDHGRTAEWHNVTTDDGYILSVFRVPPNSPSPNKTNGNPVIFFQHGLLASADSAVLLGPGISPAYLLADAGYDVWIGNLRGNTYSRRHKTLSNDDPKFWDFSMDEYALLDLPAMIDYVIKTTKQSRITYMGHSLGTTIGLMLLSEKQEYNDKVDCTVLLAPIAFWIPDLSAASYGLPIVRIFQELSPTGAYEIFPQNNLATFIFKYVCTINWLAMELCALPLEAYAGRDREQFTQKMMAKLVSYSSGGTSGKVFYHYLQHFDNGKFSHYDYNNDGRNFKYYNQITAPEYNLTNIKTPIIAVHSLNDPLSSDEEVEYLLSQFSNDTKVIYYVIEYKQFTHLDYIVAKDVKKLLYDDLIQIMSQFHHSD